MNEKMQDENIVFKNKYRIKPTRLKDWDYSQNGMYSITICTKDRELYFGNVKDGIMELSKIGEIAQQYWLEISKHYPFVGLDDFIVMPNHIHGIVIINKNDIDVETPQVEMPRVETPQWGVSTTSTSITIQTNNNPTKIGGINQNWKPNSLGSIINQFKSICTKQIRKLHSPNFQWQARFYDHIIRGERSLNRIREYVRNNPLKWEFDRNNPEYKGNGEKW